MSSQTPDRARVIPLRPAVTAAPTAREPLWRHVVGDVLRRERLGQERRLKDVAEAARISMPYLSEIERGRKEASSEILAAAAHALGLGLADLLSLAQDELVRARQVSHRRAGAAVLPERDLGSGHGVPVSDDGRLAVPAGQPVIPPAAPEARLAFGGAQPWVTPGPVAAPRRTPWRIQVSLAA